METTGNHFGQTFLLANAFLLSMATSSLAQSTLPPPPTNEQDEDVYQFEAPSNAPSNTLFRVQVYGSSEQLLTLVRRVEPSAFVRSGENVIQAGLFAETENAQELVRSLSEQGIEADIVEIAQRQQNVSSASNNAPREVISLSSPTPSETLIEVSPNQETELIPIAVESPSPETELSVQEDAQGYYVIIPTRKKFIPPTVAMVREAGVREALIQQRDAPRGDHVAVGPFSQREQANRWSSQLQAEGLDARVYFGR